MSEIHWFHTVGWSESRLQKREVILRQLTQSLFQQKLSFRDLLQVARALLGTLHRYWGY